MEKDNINMYGFSDDAIMAEIGRFVKETRLAQNKTQQQVAEEAGINRSTLILLEQGSGGTLSTFIQVMRVLRELHLFSNFKITQQISPMLLAKQEQYQRKRARGKSGTEPKSDW